MPGGPPTTGSLRARPSERASEPASQPASGIDDCRLHRWLESNFGPTTLLERSQCVWLSKLLILILLAYLQLRLAVVTSRPLSHRPTSAEQQENARTHVGLCWWTLFCIGRHPRPTWAQTRTIRPHSLPLSDAPDWWEEFGAELGRAGRPLDQLTTVPLRYELSLYVCVSPLPPLSFCAFELSARQQPKLRPRPGEWDEEDARKVMFAHMVAPARLLRRRVGTNTSI